MAERDLMQAQGKEFYVLAGGGSCGKSTLIDALSKRGYNTLDEVARKVLEERKDMPLSQNEWKLRQIEIYKRQLQNEHNAYGMTFLDRSAIEGYAYSELFLGEIPHEIREPPAWKYQKVFALDTLPLKKDGIRIEQNDDDVRKIHEKIVDTYKKHGYEPVRVPVFAGNLEESVAKRADFILNYIGVRN